MYLFFVVYFFLHLFLIEYVSIIVAMSDLVHDVEAVFQLC